MTSLYRRQWIQKGKHKRAYRKFLRGGTVWARLGWFSGGLLAIGQYGPPLLGFQVFVSRFPLGPARKPSVSSQRRRGSRYP